MANDVTIVVEASLGDTLVKLDLAKHAVNDLGDASATSAEKQAAASVATGLFSTAISDLTSSTNLAIPMLGNFAVPIIALPAVAIAATAAIIALTSVIGTLTAIVADFVAPATLLVGLLGGLGAGFLFAGISAAKGGGALQPFADKLATLHSMFSKTGNILAHAFLPYLLQLADGAQRALLFIDKLAREPLAKAMHDMATQGVQMLNKFVEQVAHVVARPIRLAFQIAFGSGPGGNEFANSVATWWHQFTGFLFGYTVRHPIELRPGVFKIESRTVDGIFTPIVDWFNRHHFTRQGIQIGKQILNGILNSTIRDRLTQFFATVFADAGKRSAAAFFKLMFSSSLPYMRIVGNAMAKVLVEVLGKAWDWVSKKAGQIWDSIKKVAGEAIQSIVDHFGNVKSAIDTVKGLANDFWGILQKIAGFFSHPFTFSVNWPSPPAWLSSIVGGLSLGGGSGSTAGRTGQGPRPNVMGANMMVIHVHGADLSDRATQARIAHQLLGEMNRQQARLADGH